MNVEPVDFPFAVIGFVDGGVENLDGASGDARRRADIPADAVPADETGNRIVGNVPATGGINGDARALFGGMNFVQMKIAHGSVPGRSHAPLAFPVHEIAG